MGSRRSFTSEFKRSVVQQLESSSAVEICRENELQPNLLHRWKKEYESNPQQAFQGKGNLWKEEAKKSSETLMRLEAVEKRGRYRAKKGS